MVQQQASSTHTATDFNKVLKGKKDEIKRQSMLHENAHNGLQNGSRHNNKSAQFGFTNKFVH